MKKILSFIICFIILCPITAYAADYGTDYPDYIDYSGGAYIEVQSTIGRGSLIFQDTYKSGYIGFYGDSYNLCNLSNSTLTGRFILENGKEYQSRFSSFGVVQYYYESGNTREWRDLDTTKVYNTNVEFIDDTELDRANKIDIFDSDPYKYTIVGLIFLIFVLIIFKCIRKES